MGLDYLVFIVKGPTSNLCTLQTNGISLRSPVRSTLLKETSFRLGFSTDRIILHKENSCNSIKE